jgi:hypothetical protein
MPTARIACCFSTNEFLLEIVRLHFVEMVYTSELLLERLLSCHCADVNNTSHDSCDIMCLIYPNFFTLLLLLSPGECHWSWWQVSSFHEVSSVLTCWLLVGAIGLSRTDTSSIVSLLNRYFKPTM